MKLSDKGRIIKPPKLKGIAQKVSTEIQSWKGIISATHWYIGDLHQVDGADFYVGEKELGHIHLDGEIHLALTRSLRNRLIEAGFAKAFRWREDWVRFRIEDPKSAHHALWLFQLAYDRLKGVDGKELRHRIDAGPSNREH